MPSRRKPKETRRSTATARLPTLKDLPPASHTYLVERQVYGIAWLLQIPLASARKLREELVGGSYANLHSRFPRERQSTASIVQRFAHLSSAESFAARAEDICHLRICDASTRSFEDELGDTIRSFDLVRIAWELRDGPFCIQAGTTASDYATAAVLPDGRIALVLTPLGEALSQIYPAFTRGRADDKGVGNHAKCLWALLSKDNYLSRWFYNIWGVSDYRPPRDRGKPPSDSHIQEWIKAAEPVVSELVNLLEEILPDHLQDAVTIPDDRTDFGELSSDMADCETLFCAFIRCAQYYLLKGDYSAALKYGQRVQRHFDYAGDSGQALIDICHLMLGHEELGDEDLVFRRGSMGFARLLVRYLHSMGRNDHRAAALFVVNLVECEWPVEDFFTRSGVAPNTPADTEVGEGLDYSFLQMWETLWYVRSLLREHPDRLHKLCQLYADPETRTVIRNYRNAFDARFNDLTDTPELLRRAPEIEAWALNDPRVAQLRKELARFIECRLASSSMFHFSHWN